MTALITIIAAKFGALGVPEPLRKVAAWAALVLAVFLLLWGAKAAYDASVIRDHEKDQTVKAIDALDQSAEDRANDAITNILKDKDRNDAINSAPTGGTLSPAERALNCERLRQLGRTPAACRPAGSD